MTAFVQRSWPAYWAGDSGWAVRSNKVNDAAMTLPNPQSNHAREAASVADLMKLSGLRPTRQRLALGGLLFGGEDRHVTAEQLHAEVVGLGEHVSLATVYNTLHQFKRAGLLRELAIDGSKAYFDTNTSNHNHFLLEQSGELMDIPGDSIEVSGVPQPPEGLKISHIDVIIRLAKT